MTQLFAPEDVTASSLTERDLLAALQARYGTKDGNGPRWALACHVRDRAGFNATRTLDAVAMDTWPSSGLLLHGFEIKCSRSDWRRELADPSKAAAFTRFLDRFWVVAPQGIVRRDELPEHWGLLELGRGGLVAKVQAQPLKPEPMDRSFLACLMRAACQRQPPAVYAPPEIRCKSERLINGVSRRCDLEPNHEGQHVSGTRRWTKLSHDPTQRAEATTTPEGAKGWVDQAGSAQVLAGGHGLDVAPDASPGGSELRPADEQDGGGKPSTAPYAARAAVVRDDAALVEAIRRNALAWHGPLLGTGHERALAVIADWIDNGLPDALAAAVPEAGKDAG